MLKVNELNLDYDGSFEAVVTEADESFVVMGEIAHGVYGAEIWIANSHGLDEDDLIEAINKKIKE